jgi:hypothetical protein
MLYRRAEDQVEARADIFLLIKYRCRILVEIPIDGEDGNLEIQDDPDHPEMVKMCCPLPVGFFNPDEVDYDGSVDPSHHKLKVLVKYPDVIIKAQVRTNIKILMREPDE